jgi:hypothetical protein
MNFRLYKKLRAFYNVIKNMFDDLNQEKDLNQANQGVVNNPNSTKAEDMFAEFEPATEKPSQFQANTVNSINNNLGAAEVHKGGMQKVFVLSLTLLGFILLGVGAYLGYDYLKSKKPAVTNQSEPLVENQQPKTDEIVNNPGTDSIDPAVVTSKTIDSDTDGLTDVEERQLNTNSVNVDTDNDGLTDREEVRVYKTNPLLADSDTDGLSDGAEVGSNRNPLGDGDLYSKSVTSTNPADTTVPPISSQDTTGGQEPVVEGDLPITDTEILGKEIKVDETISDALLDSDKDGLTDVEEVKYKTDPLNSDTDGDSYLDGSEVKGGYNPLGDGKI